MSNELERLQNELEEKRIRIEAMEEFERELGLKVQALVEQKDKRIRELENEVHELSLVPPQLDERNNFLADLLRQKENEVEALEERVSGIISERIDRPPSLSLTDSMIDYEKRVEELRHELSGKDSEIRQLRGILDTQVSSEITSPGIQTPSLRHAPLSVVGHIVSVSPRNALVDNQDIEIIKSLRVKLEESFAEMGKLKRAYCELPAGIPAEAIRGSEAVVNVCMQQVKEYKRAAERYKREAQVLKKSMSDPIESKTGIALLKAEEAINRQCLEDNKSDLIERLQAELLNLKEQVAMTLNSGVKGACKPFSSESRILNVSRCGVVFCIPEKQLLELPAGSTPPIPLFKKFETSHLSNPPLPIAGGSKAAALNSLETMANRLREETAVRRRIETENEDLREKLSKESQSRQLCDQHRDEELNELRQQLNDLREVKTELKSKELDVRNIRGKMVEMRKELQLLEIEKEEFETEKRKMLRIIDSLRQAKKAIAVPSVDPNTAKLEDELAKLKKDVEHMKSRPVTPKKVTNTQSGKILSKRPILSLAVSIAQVKVFFPNHTPTNHQSELVLKLQSQLMGTEDELSSCRRQLMVDSRRELDLERLRSNQLEQQVISLQAQMEDLKYQLDRTRGANSDMELCLALKQSESELEQVISESDMKTVDILKLKSRILDLEFERTDLARRAERSAEQRDLIQSELLRERAAKHAVSVPIVKTDNTSHLEQMLDCLQKEHDKEKRLLAQRVKDNQKMEQELYELRQQREQDKVALSEAEHVLGLIEQTEKKYLKVAKENSKLRKDLSALNDDTFWSDLENLQTDYQESIDILKIVSPLVRDPALVTRIRKLRAGSDS